jgi:LysM repeat protein
VARPARMTERGWLLSRAMDGRDRRGRSRSGDRSPRRGYAFPRAEHRQQGYGSQARRDNRQMPYIIGFVVVVAALAVFLYVGLNWATGPGRAAALATPPTPTAIAVVPPQAPTAVPSPTVGEQTYIVQAGDSPASIAAKFRIKTDDLIAANNISDPQKLQIGQLLKIPAPPSGG